MSIIGAAFYPHPPLVLPEVGQGQERAAAATIAGMQRLSAMIAELKPQIVAVVTPHGPAFSDVIAVTDAKELSGTMERFRAPEVRLTKPVHQALLSAFEEEWTGDNLPVARLDGATLRKLGAKPELDHGALVPLLYLEKQLSDYTILHISPGGQPLRRQFLAGRALARAAARLDIPVLVLASGDMSHKLKSSGPYGFDPAGPQFDKLIADAIGSGKPGNILTIDSGLARSAGECGWRPAAFALGALDGHAVESQLISYEGPFGVGYLTALLTVKEGAAPGFLDELDRAEQGRAAAFRKSEDDYVRLARETIERFVRGGKRPQWVDLKQDISELDALRMEKRKAGAFVSLHLEGELRGCMGTIVPVYQHVGEEILRNAVTACSEDPRFQPVQPDELLGLAVKVDVLSPFEPVASPDELDPARYGVIVEKQGRRGLLLPALEGVDTVERQLEIACRKAGFAWKAGDGAIKLFRFTVERHGEED